MIIDCAHYRDGRRQHQAPMTLEEAAERRREGAPRYDDEREVTDFYRAVHPLIGSTAALDKASWAGDVLPYFRDVRDHLQLINEEVAAQRDLLTTVLEANMAVVSFEQNRISVQQNGTIQQLTVIATVFLPLSFVVGFFGQNFGWLTERIDGPVAFWLLGADGLLLSTALLFWWLGRTSARRAVPGAALTGVRHD